MVQAEAASDELMLAEELAADPDVSSLQQELDHKHNLLQQHTQELEQLQVCIPVSSSVQFCSQAQLVNRHH